MRYKILADYTRYYKESEEGEKAMCRIMEELIENEKIEHSKDIAIKLLKAGKMLKEDIAYMVGLPIEVINELEQELEVVHS